MQSVTVLFADICNFTELSSRIEAFPMVAQLNHLFSMWDLLVVKHNLEKIKTYDIAFPLSSYPSVLLEY